MAAINIWHSEYSELVLGSNLTEDAIFRRALLIPAIKQRLKFLDDACGKDTALRDHLAKLLEADAKEWKQFDSVLQQQPTSKEAADPKPSIENYQLHERIGSGGMADVFAAEQVTPFRRQVAVKVQRTNHFDSESFHRFEAEQQTLATLKHENIATIYDAGITTNGSPYVSMELVRGEPITTYCNDHRLTVEDRLRLMLDVFNGIEYAHHNGVIHRDLKPANILIAEKVHGPQPKIIDFGIAKNTQNSGNYKETKTGAILGTLDYMSPEQLGDSASPVDAHSDIFSLGVILHEMLVDEIPLEKELVESKTLEERLRCMRTSVPVPISRTLMHSDSSGQLSENRNTSFEALEQQFTPALDRVVSRMIAKRPEERYATVQQVTTDLEQILGSMNLDKNSTPSTSNKVSKGLFRPAAIYFLSVLFLLGLLTAFQSSQTQSERNLDRSESNNQRSVRQRDSNVESDTATPLSPDKEAARTELSKESPPAQANSDLQSYKSRDIDEFYYRIHDRRPVAALQLANSWPADPQLEKLREQLAVDVRLTALPQDAVVEICDWIREPFEWHRVDFTDGVVKLPLGTVFIEPLGRSYTRSFRIRITCNGYITKECLLNPTELKAMGDDIQLVKKTEETPRDMTLVSELTRPSKTGVTDGSVAPPHELIFWMDRHEVSNEDYFEFVEAGAYERPEFWKTTPFMRDGEELTFEAAMKRFVDRTGEPGPASWSKGRFPKGMDQHPVSGLSFFEATAYACYRGKQLPTAAQWHFAASGEATIGMVSRNNFASNGPATCGAHSGISRFNIRDLGGNVREWCCNGQQPEHSYTLGGSWKSPSAAIHLNIATNHWDRSEVNGVRCCKSIGSLKQTQAPLANAKPVVFPTHENLEYALPELAELRPLYEYDRKTPTNPSGNQIANATFASLGMSHTIAQIQSAHDPSRYNLHLLASTKPNTPLRCVIVLPDALQTSHSSYSLAPLTSENPEALAITADILSRYRLMLCMPDLSRPFYVAGGNQLASKPPTQHTPDEQTDNLVKKVKDTMRALDYLLSRSDLDAEQCFLLAFGRRAASAIRLLALDDRFQAGVLVGGGYGKLSRIGRQMRPLMRHSNAAHHFAPHVKKPLLMINGSRDLLFPETLSQRPLYQELGSTRKNKIMLGTNLLNEPQHLGEILLHAADWFQKHSTPR